MTFVISMEVKKTAQKWQYGHNHNFSAIVRVHLIYYSSKSQLVRIKAYWFSMIESHHVLTATVLGDPADSGR